MQTDWRDSALRDQLQREPVSHQSDDRRSRVASHKFRSRLGEAEDRGRVHARDIEPRDRARCVDLYCIHDPRAAGLSHAVVRGSVVSSATFLRAAAFGLRGVPLRRLAAFVSCEDVQIRSVGAGILRLCTSGHAAGTGIRNDKRGKGNVRESSAHRAVDGPL